MPSTYGPQRRRQPPGSTTAAEPGQSSYATKRIQSGISDDGTPWLIVVARPEQGVYDVSWADGVNARINSAVYGFFAFFWHMIAGDKAQRYRVAVFLRDYNEVWTFDQANVTEYFASHSDAAHRASYWQQNLAAVPAVADEDWL